MITPLRLCIDIKLAQQLILISKTLCVCVCVYVGFYASVHRECVENGDLSFQGVQFKNEEGS